MKPALDERDPLGAALGSLERQVMDIVWDGGSFTVRDVHAKLSRPVAYTTVMTVLDRMGRETLYLAGEKDD